ncbi:DASH complex subunit Spc34 [Fusarium phyllophilum]|uniref:DASH complex subunit SPC34 n=1 Tax=Fusarium phyllophilum TaxID=47803 RepID=A0A8H5NNJ9_9HYPO|nr:DASH complex subunit Spc34 [Fusarium phyllophilum]
MSLISAHLEQIGYSCQGIDSLPFPPPKIFTNALLSNHDITSLIRDTEPHERALFSVPPPPPPSTTLKPTEPEKKKSSGRRQTVFNVASGEVTTGPPPRTGTHPRRQTAVAAVLGGQMHEELRRGESDRKGDVDVNILLSGAEKLCGVYELPGARERIAALRSKHAHGKNTAAYYEARVAEQAEQLASLDHRDWYDEEEEEEEEGEVWTEDDLRREEEGAKEMEVKKRELQVRLRQMEKDLGAVYNMREKFHLILSKQVFSRHNELLKNISNILRSINGILIIDDIPWHAPDALFLHTTNFIINLLTPIITIQPLPRFVPLKACLNRRGH